jgi:carbon monoxide dehydrogenase subunit G
MPAPKQGESKMASIRKEISTAARPDDVWDALRDIGALHTRLVPGFVTDTRLEPDARVVTFGNGVVARELIVTVDDDERRFVWSVVGGSMTHHNGSAQVFCDAKGLTKVVWIADLLPDEAAGAVGAMMEQGMAVMKQTLDCLADDATKAKARDKRPA